VVLYAPVGLAVTIVEELPELAHKGRTRLDQRTATARVVGRFAVAEGCRRLRQGAAAPSPPPGARSSGTGTAAAETTPYEAAPDATVPGQTVPGQTVPGQTVPEEVIGRPDLQAVPDIGPVGFGPADIGPAARADRVPPASGNLAIPGYDSLSASQVVQRLASLSSDELEAVRNYEQSTRGRRTILARVLQLQRT